MILQIVFRSIDFRFINFRLIRFGSQNRFHVCRFLFKFQHQSNSTYPKTCKRIAIKRNESNQQIQKSLHESIETSNSKSKLKAKSKYQNPSKTNPIHNPPYQQAGLIGTFSLDGDGRWRRKQKYKDEGTRIKNMAAKSH